MHVRDVTMSEFLNTVIERSATVPVLVDIWAEWCGPCKTLGPTLEKLAGEYDGRFELAKVNADAEGDLAAQLGVRSLPTCLLFKDGQVVDHFVGAQPEGAIREILDKHVEQTVATVENPLDEAREALAGGDANAAIARLHALLADDPENDELKIELAGALLVAGQTDMARSILDDVPEPLRDSDVAKPVYARLGFVDTAATAPALNELRSRIGDDPQDLKARHQLGARELLAGRHADGMDQFMEIVRRDRAFEDDIGRKSLLSAFALLDGDSVVSEYRRKLASILL